MLVAALFTIGTACYGVPIISKRDGAADGGTDSGTAGTSGSSGSGGEVGTGGGAGSGGVAGTGGVGGRGGSAGVSGTAGTNGGKELGQNCTSDLECNSGNCAGKVCCNQACTGLCQQCSAAGECQMPADDPACGTIICPTDTVCRDYASSISSNRCKAIGQCKAEADCGHVDTPAKQVCGFVRGMSEVAQAACDGVGNCVGPKVKCGGDGVCSPFDNMNCCGGPGHGLTCQASVCPANEGPFWCDEKADCAPGYVCCAFLLPTPAVGSSCVRVEDCVSSGPSNYSQVCNPAASPSECATGSCQLADGVVAPPGFYICK